MYKLYTHTHTHTHTHTDLNGCKCGERTEHEINYAGDVRSLHAFGFDGVKIDGCGAQKNQTLYAQLMRESGRNYTIENCHWGDCTDGDDSSCPTQDWCPWNWYRTSQDINAGALSWLSNLQTTTRFQDYDAPLSVPGCWAYPDMLEVGRVAAPLPGTETTWNRAHFGAWCIVSAPLILGLELTDAKLAPVLDIIGNKAAVAINQQWAGHPGMLVQNIVAPPQAATPGGAVLTVPSDSPGDFGTKGGAAITGGRADAASSGAADIRTGGPGSTSVVQIGTGVLGVPGAMAITTLSMEFRYLAGYTPGPGQRKKGAVVTVQFLDMQTGRPVGKSGAGVWTSAPLGNYSWDHGDPNSPPVRVAVDGLDVPLSTDAPVILALSVANNDRNLQIPIDDKSGGMHVQLGFGAGGARPTPAPTPTPTPSGFVGLAPYDGSVPTGCGQLWAKPQPDGALAVLLINHGGKKIDSFSVRLRETLNLTAAARYDILDVWTQKPRGAGTGGAQTQGGNLTFVSVGAYDSDFLLLTPAKA